MRCQMRVHPESVAVAVGQPKSSLGGNDRVRAKEEKRAPPKLPETRRAVQPVRAVGQKAASGVTAGMPASAGSGDARFRMDSGPDQSGRLRPSSQTRVHV